MIHADITVTVTNFVDALAAIDNATTPVYSSANLKLAPTRGIKNQPRANAFWVWDKAEIDFIFPAASGFTPISISFVENGSVNVGDPRGTRNMPRVNIKRLKKGNDAALQIVDEWRNKGAKGTCSWKFTLLIEDSAGRLGIIDPEISNTDQEPFARPVRRRRRNRIKQARKARSA